MIKWIFFDIGSTLVDETDCEQYRLEETIKGSDLDFSLFLKEYRELCSNNLPAYRIMVKKYNLLFIPWPSFKEKEMSGVEDVLKHFYGKFKLGIIANQPLGTVERLKKLGIEKYFDVIISSAEEGVEKPDEKIFLLGLSRAGINANEAIMIGDRLDNDILPSMKLGFKTIWIKRSYGALGNKDLLPKKIDFIIEDLRELIDIDIDALKNL